jgi:hypothetical protein
MYVDMFDIFRQSFVNNAKVTKRDLRNKGDLSNEKILQSKRLHGGGREAS